MGKKKQWFHELKIGAQISQGDNQDDENGHGEEWGENPSFITKYYDRSRFRIMIKKYWNNSRSNH